MAGNGSVREENEIQSWSRVIFPFYLLPASQSSLEVKVQLLPLQLIDYSGFMCICISCDRGRDELTSFKKRISAKEWSQNSVH